MQKKVLDEFYSEEEEKQPTRKQKNSSSNNNNKDNQEKDLRQKRTIQSQKSMRAERRQTKTRGKETGLSIDDVKKLDNL